MYLIVQVNSILTDVLDLRGPWTCNTPHRPSLIGRSIGAARRPRGTAVGAEISYMQAEPPVHAYLGQGGLRMRNGIKTEMRLSTS